MWEARESRRLLNPGKVGHGGTPHEPFPDAARAARRDSSYESTISVARRIAGINDLKIGHRVVPKAGPAVHDRAVHWMDAWTKARVRDGPQPGAAFDP